MIDFLKLTTENQNLINDLLKFAEDNLKPHRAQNNYYLAFSNGSGRFRFEFRKIVKEGELLGFRNVEICFSPHYIFNSDLHNANNFTPQQCIDIIKYVLDFLGIQKTNFKEFAVTNIEFGLNLQISGVPDIVGGILYTKRTPFQTKGFSSFKISLSTKHKEIKTYDKGCQFPMYGIGEVFRFEVRIKKSRNIQKLGIYDVSDLLEIEKYNSLFQSIVDEWEQILIINKKLNTKENTKQFWDDVLHEKNRNRFGIEKRKYYENLHDSENLHREIKVKIIDKINNLSRCANSPQKHPIKRDFLKMENDVNY